MARVVLLGVAMFKRRPAVLSLLLFWPAIILVFAAWAGSPREPPPAPPPPQVVVKERVVEIERKKAVPIKLGRDEYRLTDEYLDRHESSTGCRTDARIMPSFAAGKPAGVKLFSIRPRALEAYSSLKSAKSVTVKLLRDRQPRTFRYFIGGKI